MSVKNNYNGDWTKCHIRLLKNAHCDDRKQLDKEKGAITKHYKTNDDYKLINRSIAGRTEKEYYHVEIFVRGTERNLHK